MKLRLARYETRMSSTSLPGFRSASRAAFWLSIGAQSIVYWWIFIMASMSAGGAQAYPSRKPVIAHALENP